MAEKKGKLSTPTRVFQIAANPHKTSGRLTRFGLSWFAKQVFLGDSDVESDNDIGKLIEDNDDYASQILKNSSLISDLNFESKEDSEKIIKRLEENKDSLEWWALLVGKFNAIAEDALAENDTKKAAWAIYKAERSRAMCVFKIHLEEVTYMGHSAGRLINVLEVWNNNPSNRDEEFWQKLFNDNPFVLAQIFSVPVVFVKDKAYVGGTGIDRQNAKLVDYLYANDSSNEALLIELKTPATQLMMKTAYRKKEVYAPCKDLSGSVIQVLNYRRQLSLELRSLLANSENEFQVDVFNPRCVVVIGNGREELNNEFKQKSFELYRTSLKDVEIITYDELFKKVETLATLFNLVAEKS